ncbi:hypothetical protein [Niameybacter massiliensis]|uniref:hypothetical protein n=1 Tax=Niameybacter massiliensis TaxID=1658108 RepID=UPI0006B4676E|nr:hypothetical protein [Niameybacter massiliensis]
MDTMEIIQKEHLTIKSILRQMKSELVSLVQDQRVDKVMWSICLAFVKENIIGFHHLRERELIMNYRLGGNYKQYEELMNSINERHELIACHYERLVEFWNYYQNGHTLARYNVMEEGESLILLMEISMTMEEKLFDLTRNECIVQ